MKILVLGASGQLGCCIKHVAQGATDHYHFATREILDLSDTSAIEQFATREGIEVIINCAAYTAVDRAEDEPKQADEVNHLAVARLSGLTDASASSSSISPPTTSSLGAALYPTRRTCPRSLSVSTG